MKKILGLVFCVLLSTSGFTQSIPIQSIREINGVFNYRPLGSVYKPISTSGGSGVSSFSALSGKPTTLSGYGITDAAPLNSPSFTGTPTAPTPSTATSTSQVATMAAVHGITDPMKLNQDSLLISRNAGTALENEWAFWDFWDAMYNYTISSAGKLIGIAGYGDSVGEHMLVPFFRGLTTSYPTAGASIPVNGAILATLNPVLTGVVPYNQGGFNSQFLTDGKQTTGITLTRSGSTATLTTAINHGLTVGSYVTISGANQTEYNGTFQVLSVANATTATFAVTGTPATPATGSITVYGGDSDYTYLPNSKHIELANGATLTLDASSQTGNTKWRTILATGPGMGSAQVDLLNYSTSAVISTTTVSLSAVSSLSAVTVSFPTSTSATYKLRITATGKVVHLMSLATPDNGIIPVSFAQGGSTFTQNNFSSDNIFKFICNELNVKLLITEAKEEGLPGSLIPYATRMNSLTNVTKFIVGSSQDLVPNNTVTYANTLFRAMALANQWPYFDMNKAMGSNYSNSSRLGWVPDNVHPNDVQNSWHANLVLAKLNLPRIYGSTERRNIFSTQITGSIFSVPDVDATQKIDLINTYGAAQPGVAVAKNFRGVYVKSAGQDIGISGYDGSNIAITNRSGDALAGLRVSGLRATAVAYSESDHFIQRLHGSGSAPAITVNTGAGTGATASIVGTDVAGTITIVTGTSPVASGIICRVTFTANSSAPDVVFSPTDTDISAVQYSRFRVGNRAGSQFELVNTGVALDASSTYTFTYHVIRR